MANSGHDYFLRDMPHSALYLNKKYLWKSRPLECLPRRPPDRILSGHLVRRFALAVMLPPPNALEERSFGWGGFGVAMERTGSRQGTPTHRSSHFTSPPAPFASGVRMRGSNPFDARDDLVGRTSR